MRYRPTEVLARAKHVCRTEGVRPLLRRGLAFVIWHFFEYERCYLFEHATDNIRKLDEGDFMPMVDDFTLKIVSTNQEADKLAAEGLEFRSYRINASERLNKGAIAFCVFVGQELAYISWGAMTQQAKDALKELPYRVDISNNEVCSGDLWTNPKYRNRGLRTYTRFKRLQWLFDHGIVVSRSVAPKRNVPANVSAAKLSPKVTEARYLKILWRKFWKEKPLA